MRVGEQDDIAAGLRGAKVSCGGDSEMIRAEEARVVQYKMSLKERSVSNTR